MRPAWSAEQEATEAPNPKEGEASVAVNKGWKGRVKSATKSGASTANTEQGKQSKHGKHGKPRRYGRDFNVA